jgi:2-polyprenyl-6-methoxyphenol hydroxylase-like FAD-dependent oxidoreductase
VIGAGVAGLTAARVLSRRYATVTVLDRDTLPYDASPRHGVPQGEHPHLLLAGGLRELTTLFPGLDEQLIALGGVRLDTGRDIRTFRLGAVWPGEPSGLDLVSVTRPRLEAVLRARVGALGGVAIRDQIAVSGLTGVDGRVDGVVLDTGETLGAALVVDCSGRGSRSDRWLGALGLPLPARIEVKVEVGYSTRFYRRRPGDLGRWQAAVVLPHGPQESMSGLALPVEGDRWIVGLGGWHLSDPPGDPAAFEAYAKGLPDPAVATLIARTEPLGDVRTTRFPSSRRRLFERLDRLPAGYVTLGDAICSFNPIYGQGMTSAARQASVLGEALDRHHRVADAELAADYYAATAEVIDVPWGLAIGGDFRFPGTTGPRPRGLALRNWYSRQITYASQVDGEVFRVASAVQQLVAPPAVLKRPAFVARVLRQARNRRRA